MRAVLPRLFVVLLIGVFGARSVTLVSADDSPPSTPTALVPISADLAHEQITQALAVIRVAELEAQAAAEALAQAQEVERVEQERLAAEQAETERVAAEEAQRAQEELRRASIAPQAQRRSIPASVGQPEVERIIREISAEYGVDPELMIRIAWCESGLRSNAVNASSGASGLFQQMPQFWSGRSSSAGIPGADIFDPLANTRVSAMMMAGQGTRPWVSSQHCWG